MRENSPRRIAKLAVAALHLVLAWALLHPAPMTPAPRQAAAVVYAWIEPLRAITAQPPTAAPEAAPSKRLSRRDAPRPTSIETPRPDPPPSQARAEPERTAAAEPQPVAAAIAMPPPAVELSADRTPVAPPPPPPVRSVAITTVEYLVPPVPEYPPPSRRLNEQGQVLVRVLVDAQGLPQQLSLLRSSNHPRLDDAALAAVRRARFKPYTENGAALPFWVVVPLLFEIEG